MNFIDLKAQYSVLHSLVNQNISKVLEHGMFINGPEVADLEGKLAEFTGAKHAIGCASGTDALQISLMAIGCKHGDEIITTPFTFIATAEVILLLGLKPVFVDINPETYQIDHTKIPSAITPKTKAIITVSLYGQCSEMDEINEIAKENNLIVIEDAAQSFGATYKNKKSCNLSDIGCTSFFPSKPLGCYGDGGLVTTSSDEIAKKLKMIRDHGQKQRYQHCCVGVNSRLDTIQAAILLAKMTIFENELAARTKIGKRYDSLLQGLVQLPKILPHNTSVYAQYTIQVENRSDIIQYLSSQGIPTAVHYPTGVHLQEIMTGHGFTKGQFPQTERASERVMSLPMHPYLSESDQASIVEKLKISLRRCQKNQSSNVGLTHSNQNLDTIES